jgi:hypothetical protein
MAEIKLKHLNKFWSKNCRRFVYVCRPPGFKSKALKGALGSEAFMADYNDWLARAGVSAEIGASRTKSGTIDAAIVAYLKHDTFSKGLAEATQAMRRAILDRFRNTCGPRKTGSRRCAGSWHSRS